MIYPGDNKVFVLSILGTTPGSNPNVTSGPLITIVEATSGGVLVAGANMTYLPGTQKVYSYSWSTVGISQGTYVAVVSYISDAVTYNSRHLETVLLGDTFLTGPVALNATVAKDSTVAKDLTVFHLTDYIPLSSDSTILSIKAKTDLLPADPVSFSGLASMTQKVSDIRDYCLGSWLLDNVANTLTLLKSNGDTLMIFNLAVTPTTNTRVPAF